MRQYFEHVVQGDDAHQFVVRPDHRYAPNAVLAHGLHQMRQRIIFLGGDQAFAHHVFQAQRFRVQAQGHHRHDDVTVGDQASHLAAAVGVFHHHDRAYMVFAHELGRRHHTCVLVSHRDFAFADIPRRQCLAHHGSWLQC